MLAASPRIGYGLTMQRSVLYLTVIFASLLTPALAPGATRPPPAVPQALRHPVQATAAEGVARLGGTQNWQAYSDMVKGHKICYLVGEPDKTEPEGAKRAKVFVTVTHRPAEKVTNEVSFNAGYLFKEGSEAELLVDAKKFMLFTNKDGAWARDPAGDKAVVEALAKGKQAVVKGMSARGTATTDTYLLAGFAQALAQIDKACAIKR